MEGTLSSGQTGFPPGDVSPRSSGEMPQRGIGGGERAERLALPDSHPDVQVTGRKNELFSCGLKVPSVEVSHNINHFDIECLWDDKNFVSSTEGHREECQQSDCTKHKNSFAILTLRRLTP